MQSLVRATQCVLWPGHSTGRQESGQKWPRASWASAERRWHPPHGLTEVVDRAKGTSELRGHQQVLRDSGSSKNGAPPSLALGVRGKSGPAGRAGPMQGAPGWEGLGRGMSIPTSHLPLPVSFLLMFLWPNATGAESQGTQRGSPWRLTFWGTEQGKGREGSGVHPTLQHCQRTKDDVPEETRKTPNFPFPECRRPGQGLSRPWSQAGL